MKISRPIVIKNSAFTRDTPAAYYNASGILTTAVINEVRLGYDPTSLAYIGEIIEPQGINYFKYSNSFLIGDYHWQAIGTISTTADVTTSPDGTTNASLINPTSTGLIKAVLATGAGWKIFSVYVKDPNAPTPGTCSLRLNFGPTVTSVFRIDPGGADAFEPNTTIQELPDYWYRISIAAEMFAYSNKVEIEGIGGVDFYAYGAQVEDVIGDYIPSSYINSPEGASTVRAPDLVASPPSLLTSNISEADADLWDSLTEYVEGDRVMVLGAYHKIYSATGDNDNKFPPSNTPAIWIDEGSTNRWRMFNMDVGIENQSVSTDPDNTIHVVLDLNQPVSTLTLLNIYASNVTITMRDADDNIVYTHYEAFLTAPFDTGWWEYYFGTRERSTSLVLTDLPNIFPCTLEMVLDGDDDVAKIGKMIPGDLVDIGCTQYGTSYGSIDFSTKGRDPFGNNFVVERRYVDKCDYNIQVSTPRAADIKRLIDSLRATNAVYIGDEEFGATVIYGFRGDFLFTTVNHKFTDLTLHVEGI